MTLWTSCKQYKNANIGDGLWLSNQHWSCCLLTHKRGIFDSKYYKRPRYIKYFIIILWLKWHFVHLNVSCFCAKKIVWKYYCLRFCTDLTVFTIYIYCVTMYSVPFQWESEPSDNDRNGKTILLNFTKRKSSNIGIIWNLNTFMCKRAVLYVT